MSLMKNIFVAIVILSVALPVRAEIPKGFDPVEQKLIQKKLIEDELGRDFRQQTDERLSSGKNAKKGSTWWKWALGILVVGGIAAAAGGGGGGSSTPAPPTTGTVTTTW